MQSEEQTPLKPTRAAFIRSLPLTVPVEEVIERAREVGLQLQPSDVHAARYYMRQGPGVESAGRPAFTKPFANGGGNAAREARENREHKEPPKTVAASGQVSSVRAALDQAALTRSVLDSKSRSTASKKRARKLIPTGDTPDEQLYFLVLRLGCDRARELIGRIESNSRKALGRRG
jgi:hypothetical protein